MIRKLNILLALIALCFGALQELHSQNKLDSIQELPDFVVVAKSFREVIPVQKLSGKELKSLNSFSVADAIRYFSGVQLKDYGGIGGLKTINIRSMGSHHVGIFYDGIQLGNAQNGQIDLGKYSLENIDEISIYNGQKSDIFQPAKDFSTSGSVYIRSRTPRFEYGKNHNLRATLKTGSFDLVNPSILYEYKINDDISASFNGEYINSSGKYKFRYKRVMPGTGEVMYDTTAVRQNGDIESLRLEAGLFGLLSQGHWKLKTYFYDSERGIPGAIVNNRWMNSQRQWDRSFFAQGSLQKSITNNYQILVNAKYANDYMRYLNPDTTLMFIDNSFRQQESYLSLANQYEILDNWSASLSGDFQYNTLTSDMAGFTEPERFTSMVSLASALDLGAVKMQGSILSTFVNDRVRVDRSNPNNQTKAAKNKSEFTPAIFFSYSPSYQSPISLRAFYKRIFRMPTFNDLYYTDVGNSNLKPEFTNQYNMGAQYLKSNMNRWLKRLEVQGDIYYNKVDNKIVAVPKGSGQYRWMMMNLGMVEIKGFDFSSSTIVSITDELLMNAKLTYTYQKAQDFTKRKGGTLQQSTYGGQIPYIPWHSGSAIAGLSYKGWGLNYSFIYVGERYHNSANIRENYEQPWYTNDLSLIKDIKFNGYALKLSAEVNNVLSQDYEVVLNYPMPQRNYKFSITVEI